MKTFLIACLVVLLPGCASTMNAFFSRAVVEDNVDGAVGVLSTTAARRMVVVSLTGENRGKFCAEPPPDVSDNITASLDAALKLKIAKSPVDAEAQLKDTLAVATVVLAQRTALLDMYRTGSHALCQQRLHGWITNEDLKTSFDSLTKQVLGVYKTGTKVPDVSGVD